MGRDGIANSFRFRYEPIGNSYTLESGKHGDLGSDGNQLLPREARITMIVMAMMIVRQPWALETSSCASSSVGRVLLERLVRLEDPPIALFSE